MRGLPSIKEIRSISRFGLSSVAVYFDEKLDIYFARRLVMERLPDAAATIPQGYGPPQMTPVSTTLGEIYQFEVVDPRRSLVELRLILDWKIAPRLKEVTGVVEVNSTVGSSRPTRSSYGRIRSSPTRSLWPTCSTPWRKTI